MFHSARAFLYNKSYREKSHYCLIVALKVLYVKTGKLPVHFIEGLQRGKRLREDADYYKKWSKMGAEEMVNTANLNYSYPIYFLTEKQIQGVSVNNPPEGPHN